MHPACYQWVTDHAAAAEHVLDIGGRDINGTPRELFADAEYTVIDLEAGPNVDVVADITEWHTTQRFDVVLCLEVLEHVEDWWAIIAAAHRLTKPGGVFIVTCAGPGRAPHSAHDGGEMRGGEWYANIDPGALWTALEAFSAASVDIAGVDVRAVAVK
jgi:SAM-dependent methyltransferase